MGRRSGIVKEFTLFIKENKTYWMAPIVIMLLLLSFLVFLGGTTVAPFVYSFF